MRQINKLGLDTLKLWEGLPGGKPALKAYQDGGGVWTIGWGHTKNCFRGQVITIGIAEEFLLDDLKEALTTVEKYVKVTLNDNQFAALVMFVFNIGVNGFKTSTLLKLLNAGDYKSVPTQLARWNKDNGKVVQGLINRRNAEIVLWNKK